MEGGGPGTTTIDDAVVEKIAARAIGEVADVGGVAQRVLGIPLGTDTPDRAPRVRARVDSSIVTLDVTLSVTYPAPVGRVTREVREHVTERITALTGLATRQVDITVTALHRPQAPGRTVA
ncbi:Asp23/Gls24 family envelope stress response protein [Pseudonocardia pini]|uniref:Asp23/Gls24 family envelope stress response protein n=1 Tax=Pseudonocardia pini TaxID=2758030 RepID=UPI0028A8B532|nr:Asp23/Gls24 family envelope stress response protein [Pseudonocardia pini]